MNPYQRYARSEPDTSWTRIDLLLALYDGAIERIDRAKVCLEAGDNNGLISLVSRVQLIVSELAAGVRLDVAEEMGINYLRLYEYVVHQLSEPTAVRLQDARKVLATLREGFEAIRADANELERSGKVAAAGRLQMVMATA